MLDQILLTREMIYENLIDLNRVTKITCNNCEQNSVGTTEIFHRTLQIMKKNRLKT